MSGPVRDATAGKLLGLRVGTTLALWCPDDDVWHERLVVFPSVSSPAAYYIVTPDKDVYIEELATGEGPSRARIRGTTFTYWSRFRESSYQFSDVVDEEECRKYMRSAVKELRDPGSFGENKVTTTMLDRKGREVGTMAYVGSDILPRRRLPMRGHLAAPAAPELEVAGDYIEEVKPGVKPLREAPPQFSEELRRKCQQIFPLSIEELTPKTPAKKAEKDEDEDEGKDPEDVRILAVDYDAQIVRHKDFKAAINKLSGHSFEDWPHEGPMSTLHLVKQKFSNGGGPKGWLNEWARFKEIGEPDRVMFELRILAGSFHLVLDYDQLNVGTLASFETQAGRIQAIVDAYSAGSKGNPDWAAAKYITNYKGPEDAVSPRLLTWAST
eukprot:Skav206460  [mRNA]  locus=scaffold2468:15414:16719:- [translate_table: standard]